MDYSLKRRPRGSQASYAVRVPSNRSSRVEQVGSTVVTYDSSWVRSALSQLDFLRSLRSVDTEVGPVIEFAIRWAPFGGADSGDLLVSFGVGRRRFVEMVREGLRLRPGDDQEVRWLKRALRDALASAWFIESPVSARSVRC
ncbi:hypothetical protein [Nocardia spumae]|uniref:hypothetical protein n=1 Tax=Nocardia spumae TaxID=2887190 RepID=UPI001D149328|nr:hypothetical protein [Nocardia spumae]